MGIYLLCAVAGLCLSAWLLERSSLDSSLGKAGGSDARDRPPGVVVLGAALGFALGAKLGFVVAEAPLLASLPRETSLRLLLSGKTVTGALLGGYAGVELAKALVGHRAATGDTFALVVPFSLLLGRVGCLFAGCCPGVLVDHAAPWTMTGPDGAARWPAVPVEMLFNLAFLGWAWCYGRNHARFFGQMFHVYLVSYGVFRLLHESMRDTPRWGAFVTGYQVLSLLLVGLGAWRFVQRRRASRDAAFLGS